MTHRIEPFCSIWLKELNHWTFFFNDLKNYFFNLTRRIEPFFDMTWKIDFWKMSQIIRTLFEHDSQNWIFILKNMTQRIPPFFSTWLTELNLSSTWLIEIEPFFSTLLKELNPLFLNMTQRFELFSAKKYDSKNWTLGRKKSLKKMELFF